MSSDEFVSDGHGAKFASHSNSVHYQQEECSTSAEISESDFLRLPLQSSLTGSSLDCDLSKESYSCDDFNFTISEDSISLSESNFVAIEPTVSSTYCNTKELAVLSEDSSTREPLPQCVLFSSPNDSLDEDIFVTNTEEASMDSGLGSVESTYPNSEDDSILSPQDSKSDDEVVVAALSSETDSSTTDDFTPAADISLEQPVKFSTEVAETFSCQRGATAMTAVKRPYEGDAEENQSKKPRKKSVMFDDVTVFYFPRKQGFVSVPSQGGATLGMAMNHISFSTMTLQEHDTMIKARHDEKLAEHRREQKFAQEMMQMQYMNQGMSPMPQNVYCPPAGQDNHMQEQLDEYFFLQPLSAKKRRKLLRSSGVERIDGEEKLMNRLLRESREMCGCRCQNICLPESCECALSGIQCQVDRASFPCGCVISGCRNPNGRIEFNPERVQKHLVATLKKLNDLGSEAGSSDKDEYSCSDSEPSTAESACEEDCVLDDQSKTEDLQESNGGENKTVVDLDLPGDYLKTLGLERVNFVMESSGSPPIPTTYINTVIPDQPVSTVTDCNVIGDIYPSYSNTAVPSNYSFSQTPNPCYLDNSYGVNLDRTFPLEPIDTFMSNTFVTASNSDLHSLGGDI